MFEFSPLPAAVAASLIALGLIAPLTAHAPSRDQAVSPARVGEAVVGSRLNVLGLVGDVRTFPAGGALAPVGDCRGTWASAYFPPGVEPPASWSVALIEGSVELYGDGRELVAGQVVEGAPEGALQVDVESVAGTPSALACRPVAFTAAVRGLAADGSIEVEAANGTLRCVVHSAPGTDVVVEPGARVTLIGVPALDGRTGEWVVHVRA